MNDNKRPLIERALRAGFEIGDGRMDGAMQVDGKWWHPKFGCDSLQWTIGYMRDELEDLAMYSSGRCVCHELRDEVFP